MDMSLSIAHLERMISVHIYIYIIDYIMKKWVIMDDLVLVLGCIREQLKIFLLKKLANDPKV